MQGRIQYETKDVIASFKNWSFRFKEYEDLKILTLKIHTLSNLIFHYKIFFIIYFGFCRSTEIWFKLS